DGFNSFMALDSSGSLWVWGLATSGQLGDGSDPGNVSPPQPVPAFAGVEQIDMGPSFCLARKGDGTVWSWGDRIDGVAFSSEVLWPTLVEGLANVESVSSDSLRESAYAIKADGSVWAWGANSDNLLGDGSDLSRDAPVPVIGEAGIGFLSLKSTSIQPTLDSLAITGAALIPSGANSRYAATARYRDGRTLSVAAQWDLMDEKATVDADGLVSTLFSSSMRIVELSATYSDGDKSVVAEKQITIAGNAPDEVAPQIEARNNFHNLVLLPDGRVKSWGKNGDGQLGDGTKKTRSTAVQVNELTGVASLAANQSNSFALKSDGSVWSWGGNFYDSLGSGDSVTVDGATPGQIEGLGDIVHIASKFLNTGGYAVTANGALWEWGQERGQPSPNQLYDAPDNIVSIRDPLVVTADGKVWTLDSIRAGNPIAIEPLDNIVATATIWGFMEPVSYFALDGAGAIWAWGSNVRGQLGDGGQTPRAEPAKILGLPEVTAIAAGYESVYAVDSAGKLWSWGRNDTNIFPGGLTANVLSPTQIPGVSGVIKVAAGFKHILLLHQDGTVRTLGRNQDAQLGIGTISDSEDLSLVVDSSLTTFLDLYPVAQNDITPDLMPPFLSATITDGALENLTLDIELNLNDVLAELQPRSTGGAVYNVYVAALIPAATLNAAQDAIFTLNSSNLWSHYLGGALPAFMHNVEVASADHRLVLQILSSLDVSQLVGTTIFVGYGTSDSEMLANGRYRAVYTVLEPE
ncbi:MAG: hypothetical protein OET90_05470, partial [Desulfuromonadales bacterium]|nr:hypothetical protein [Desulfuromonadales bacterium]